MSLSINRNQLKWLAIVAMTIDHIAWAFVPTYSVPGFVMHFVGRITGPLMAYMLYEGYTHTRDVKKYMIRMGLFALISWPAFSLFEKGLVSVNYMGVIFTLFLGLLAMWIYDRSGWHTAVRFTAIAALIFLSTYGDWGLYDVICPLLLVSAGDTASRHKRFAVYTLIHGAYLMFGNCLVGGRIGWFQLGVLLPILLICLCYNGQSKKSDSRWKNAINKWFFYIYYPLHLFALYLLKLAFCG